jgi:hypothetical protein
MNPFDRVPLDILQNVLGPFLNQETMIALNQVTDPRERIYRKFPKDYAIKHHIRVLILKWKSIMLKINIYHGNDLTDKKHDAIIRLFSDQLIPVNRIIFMHYLKFRVSAINKFTNTLKIKSNSYSMEEKFRIEQYKEISKNALKLIDECKFVREIRLND